MIMFVLKSYKDLVLVNLPVFVVQTREKIRYSPNIPLAQPQRKFLPFSVGEKLPTWMSLADVETDAGKPVIFIQFNNNNVVKDYLLIRLFPL